MQPRLGRPEYIYNLSVGDQSIETEHTLNFLGIALPEHKPVINHMLSLHKKAYAKIASILRITRLVPSNVTITLYKAYVLLHFEYCSPLLLGISRTLNNKLERANYCASRSILNLVRSRYSRFMSYSIASMTTSEKRRIEKSLIVFFRGFLNDAKPMLYFQFLHT